jgi:hypothetical protein
MKYRHLRVAWSVGLVMALCVLVLSLTYVGLYLALGAVTSAPGATATAPLRAARTFNYRWQAEFFKPIGRIESNMRESEVVMAWRVTDSK